MIEARGDETGTDLCDTKTGRCQQEQRSGLAVVQPQILFNGRHQRGEDKPGREAQEKQDR